MFEPRGRLPGWEYKEDIAMKDVLFRYRVVTWDGETCTYERVYEGNDRELAFETEEKYQKMGRVVAMWSGHRRI